MRSEHFRSDAMSSSLQNARLIFGNCWQKDNSQLMILYNAVGVVICMTLLYLYAGKPQTSDHTRWSTG